MCFPTSDRRRPELNVLSPLAVVDESWRVLLGLTLQTKPLFVQPYTDRLVVNLHWMFTREVGVGKESKNPSFDFSVPSRHLKFQPWKVSGGCHGSIESSLVRLRDGRTISCPNYKLYFLFLPHDLMPFFKGEQCLRVSESPCSEDRGRRGNSDHQGTSNCCTCC